MDILPNAHNAVIPVEKFTEYALNPQKQKDKSVAFEKALGYNLENYQKLIEEIKSNLFKYSAKLKPDMGFGQRYEVVMHILGANGKTAKVLTAWIVESSTGITRLTSVYVDND